jgi:hypothetical protein
MTGTASTWSASVGLIRNNGLNLSARPIDYAKRCRTTLSLINKWPHLAQTCTLFRDGVMRSALGLGALS